MKFNYGNATVFFHTWSDNLRSHIGNWQLRAIQTNLPTTRDTVELGTRTLLGDEPKRHLNSNTAVRACRGLDNSHRVVRLQPGGDILHDHSVEGVWCIRLGLGSLKLPLLLCEIAIVAA